MSIWDYFFGGDDPAPVSAPLPPRNGIGTAPISSGMSFTPILPVVTPRQPQVAMSAITNAIPRPRMRPDDLNTSAPPRPRMRPADLNTGGRSAAPQDNASNPSFLSRLSSGDTLARLAMILDGMSMNPNQALQTVMQDKIARSQQKKAASRTVQWLRSLGTTQAIQAADALETGAIDAQTAVAFATKKHDDGKTALMQNYEYALSQGMTPEEARQWVSSGTTVQVGGKAETAFETENAKGQAGFFNNIMQEGMNAKATLGQIAVMESLLSSGIGGTADAWKAWAQDNLGINVGAGGGVEALNATINQLIPTQRAPGSGSSSDRDIAMFRASLPSLVNSPEGNRIIVATMRGMAEYKVAMGEIATAVAMGDLSREEGLRQMKDLPNPVTQAIPIIRQLVPNASAPASTMSREDAARLLLQQ